MGEFHDAVTTLLEAFASGIAIIKTLRKRRKEHRIPIDSTVKVAETHLSKSLKKNRADVQTVYGRNLSQAGGRFAVGDDEARSSLAAILFRLNAGFVSIIDRFTRGKSTGTDYKALLNLSNVSHMEAISTFEQLSKRLSQSSVALPHKSRHAGKPHSSRVGHKQKAKKGSVGHSKHTRSKSAPELSRTALGPATAEGWVRPKPGRKLSSESKTSGSTSPRRTAPREHTQPTIQRSRPPPALVSTPLLPSPLPRTRPENRRSIMSFASDSTKLGEIPEYKWASPSMFDAGNSNFPITTFYPLEPYQQPEKQRSRFMRLFRR